MTSKDIIQSFSAKLCDRGSLARKKWLISRQFEITIKNG